MENERYLEHEKNTSERMELSAEQIQKCTAAAFRAISPDYQSTATVSSVKELQEKFVQEMLAQTSAVIKGLAQELPSIVHQEEELKERITKAESKEELADLQIEFLKLQVVQIAQMGGSREAGITPALVKELKEVDCTMSSWAVQSKIFDAQIPSLSSQFAYPKYHSCNIVTIADGRTLYVDGQNALIAEVVLEPVIDEKAADTAYPLFKVQTEKMLFDESLHIQGSNYIADYLGVLPDGLLHTLGNFHMFENEEGPIYTTEVAQSFRKDLPEGWKLFQQYVERMYPGKVIYETKFGV